MIVHINKIFKSLTVFAAVCCCISAQNIYINELMSSNNSTLYDESGNSSDWIELYNAGDIEIDLTGFGLSDDINDPFKWVFPGVVVSPQSFLIVFASGDDVVSNVQHWETVINWGDSWRYFIGNSNPPSDWREQEFDDSVWSIGDSGFGYGDGDDATEVPQVMSVFVRNSFQVGSVDDIAALVLHIDYDDAFVAYLNGSEIARANIGTPGVVPNYDEGAEVWREAEIYSGGSPERYDIDQEPGLLTNGENILAIQVHNYNITSSDMSLIPFFTLGMFQPPDSPSGTPDMLNFPLANLHTNFKIASDGEAILLTNSSGAMEDMADSTAIPTDISYGRQPDGGDTWSFFPEPTPMGSNNTQGFGDYCETPQISHQGGFYPGPFIVTLSIESDNHQIYYTLDGSIPTENSYLYLEPMFIQSTKVIRAAVIDNECFPGEVITHSYFINEESTLPVVSLSTDPYNLWDEEYGIYVLGNDAEWNFPYFGANFWEDWERPIHIELYEPNGELGFNLDAGVKIFGGWSRGWPQKSLAIYARSSYGASEINYQIFPDKEIDSFSAIVLRNSGNDWFGSGEGSATMLRDGTHTGLMDNTDIDHQAYRPAAVYINGEYWGIHNIREKVNEEFLASNNPGVDPDELDELEANAGIIEGDNQDYLNMIDFVENNDLSYSNNYDFVAEQVDVDNFIDYYIIQIYVGNTDWPGNNIKYWRPHIEGAKWKWILYDTDFGSGLFSGWSSNVNHNTLLFALDDNGPGWPNPPWSTLLFRSLMENEEFQNKFINHFCYYLNTRFYPNYVVNHISEIADNITPEMPYHVSRWGGNIGQWNQNVIYVQEFGSHRADIVFDHIGNYFGLSETSNLYISASPLGAGMITISGLTITEHSPILSGKYFNDIGDRLPPDSTTGAIPSNENYDLPTADYARYNKAAAFVAAEIMAQSEDKLDSLFGCPGTWNRDCAETFIATRGMRLFRRPLSEAEVQAFLEIYDIGAQGSFEEGMQYLIEALLQSPDFLYQVELGPADSADEVRLSGLEIATRLSFFLHAEPPSQDLLDAAITGELDEDSGVEGWVDILLADVGKARFGIQQFIMRWLRMDDDEAVEKDMDLYPEFTPSVLHGLKRGAQLWAAYTVLEGDGQLETLFSASETVVRLTGSENLFWESTDADVIANSEIFGTVVALPPGERAGILTSPPRLANAHNSDGMGTRPILRGAAILKNILCGTLEPPQAFEPPGAVEGESVKDSVSFMLESPSCAGCHEAINPLGLAFEIYDGVGRYRADKIDDLGFPIETSGSFGVDGVCSEESAPFNDAVDLIKSLATNDQLRTCATIQWFRYGLRRGPRLDGSDAGNLAEIYEAFADSDFNVRALLKAIALSRPFLYRNFSEAGDEP